MVSLIVVIVCILAVKYGRQMTDEEKKYWASHSSDDGLDSDEI